MFSIYASLHSDSSFDENDMLSSSDEDNDDYKNHDTNYHTTDWNVSVVANETVICDKDMRCIYKMTQDDSDAKIMSDIDTDEKLSSTNAIDDENHLTVWAFIFYHYYKWQLFTYLRYFIKFCKGLSVCQSVSPTTTATYFDTWHFVWKILGMFVL